MKTLLVNPPWMRFYGYRAFTFPTGLCYIAAVLEENGYEASVYDVDNVKGLTQPILGGRDAFDDEVYIRYKQLQDDPDHPLWSEISAVISKQSPDIVGITAMSGQYGSSLNIARKVKELDSDIPVVIGGSHPTAMPEETIKNKDIDFVVRKEGEYTFLDLVKTLKSDKNLKDVLGITYKEKDKIIHNLERPLIENLDDLPFPARHLILDHKNYPPGSLGGMFASRGCVYKCFFCASKTSWGRGIRYRSPKKVVEEIKQVYETYLTPKFVFNDADLLINKKIVNEICDLIIEEELIIDWECSAKASEITDDIAQKMASAGC